MLGLLMVALDYVLDLMCFARFCGRRFGRSLKLYVEALVLKEICKVSLRYAEGLSLKFLGVRVPKSTLHYWEVKYEYSVVDSTKIADWFSGLHELFVNVRVRGGSTLFPVHTRLTSSEVEFINGIPEGFGFMLGDGAFDAKPD
jgi:hypothetical protein